MTPDPWRGSALDTVADGMSTVGIVGPLPDLTREKVVAAVSQVLTKDPRSRLRAVRDRSRPGSWDRDDAPAGQRAERVVSDDISLADFATATPSLIEALDDHRPIGIFVDDRHLGIALDHGLIDGGDGVRMLGLISLLACGGTAPIAESPNHARPIMTATLEFFGRHPRNVRALLQARREQPSGAIAAASDDRPSEGRPLAPAFASVVLDAETSATLRAHGKSHGASWAPIAIELLASSLRSAGVTVAAEASIIVDLRRYLPDGVSTQANMCLGQSVPIGPNVDLERTSSALTAAVAAGRPLAAAALVGARSWYRRGPRTLQRTDAAVGPGIAFLGEVSALFDLPFTGEPQLRLVSSPFDRRTVGATCFLLGRRLHLCLNFDAHSVDPDAVATAVESIRRDPLALLTDTLRSGASLVRE